MLFYYHYNLIHFYRLKKALPRHGNIPAMSIVRKQQNASNRRPVGLRPAGDFCRFSRIVISGKKSDGKGGGQQTRASIGP